jgi:hypothetical protein
MPTIQLTLPRLHLSQQTIFNRLGHRNLLRCGRRFGKTILLETVFSSRALQGRKVGWFTPDYKLMRPTFTRLRRLLAPVTTHASKTDALIELKTKGLLEFWTLDNEDAGRSRDYDDVVIDEASLVKKGLRDIVEQAIAPTLLDRDGTLTMAGTPKGIDPENFFYAASEDAKLGPLSKLGFQEFHMPTHMNPMLHRDAIAKLPDRYPPLVYQQEYLADFVDMSGDAVFSRDKLLYDGHPMEFPANCDTVFAVIDSATKTGKENDGTAVVYCALTKNPWTGPPLVILDWDITQIEGASLEVWIPNVFRTLEEYAIQCKARLGSSGAFIEDKASGMILIQQCANRNLPAHAIDSKLTSLGKSERALSVSGYVHQDKVKLSRIAFDKITNYKGITRNHLWSQVIGFRYGVKDQTDDDLLDGFTYSCAISLGNAEGF